MSLGLNISHLRDIQHIITKYTALKVQDAMETNVRVWKNRDKNHRRRENACKRREGDNSKTNTKGNSILDYLG